MQVADHHREVLTAGDLRRYLDQAKACGITDEGDMSYNPKENSLDFKKLDGTITFRVKGMPDDVRANAMMSLTAQ